MTAPDETGLSLRSSGEVADYLEPDAIRGNKVSAQVFSSTINVAVALTGGTCVAAFTSVGLAAPAAAACVRQQSTVILR